MRMLQKPNKFIPPKGPPRASAREAVLAQWRGVDLTPREVARGNPAKAAHELMPRVLTGLRFDRRRGEAEIMRVWNNSMDPSITAHAQPVGINKGTLFVNVDSSVWLDEIVRYRRKEILVRLQHSFGIELVKRISFRIG